LAILEKWATVYDQTVEEEEKKVNEAQRRKKDVLNDKILMLKKQQKGELTIEQKEVRKALREIEDEGRLSIAELQMTLRQIAELKSEEGMERFQTVGRLSSSTVELKRWMKHPDRIVLLLLNDIDPDELKEKLKTAEAEAIRKAQDNKWKKKAQGGDHSRS